MTAMINGGWVGQVGGATTSSALRWESPKIAPRVATSTVSPGMALAFSVMLAVATATTPASGGEISPRLISSAGISPYSVTTGAWTEVDTSHPDITDEVAPLLIEELRSEYKLSDSSIAEIFNVSRQTVYNWRTGKTATGYPERLGALAEALRQVKSEDVPYLQRVLFYPTSDGRLIQDTLSDKAWVQNGAAGLNGVVAELIGKAQQLRERDLKTIARLEKSGSSHSV
jgi:transcriptional regulator with XRE-family HTH domain